MADFAENGVKIFEFFDFFESFKPRELRRDLEEAMVPIDTHPGSPTRPPDDVRRRALEVKQARQLLTAFLNHPAVTAEMPKLQDAYRKMYRREFEAALGSLAGIHDHADLPAMTSSTITAAYSGPVSFGAFIEGPPDSEGEPTPIHVTRTIVRGYKGTRVPAPDLVALHAFMKAGADRKRLLEYECQHGLGGEDNLVEAIHGYANLLPPAVTAQVDLLDVSVDLFQRYVQRHKGAQQIVALPGIFATWSGPQPRQIKPTQQFVALRSALAHLALADRLWRTNRAFGVDLQRLSEVYAAAVRLVVESGVAPGNALRGQIEAHAARQRGKLAAGLNALGLWDAFVPPMRYSALEDLVQEAIGEARDYATTARNFVAAAEDRLRDVLDLVLEQDAEDATADIYRRRIDVAWLEEDKANEQVLLIKDQQEALARTTLAGLFAHLASNASVLVGGAPDPRTLAGIVETGLQYDARGDELGHQLKVAGIDVSIAEAQRDIALAELHLAEKRKDHLQQKLDFEADRKINADVLLLLADMYEKRAARVLEAAVFRAYLAERALAFVLGEELPPKIRLDYWDNPEPGSDKLDGTVRLTLAVEALQADFDDLTDPLRRPDESRQLLQEHISLSEHYPLEFARLLQEGEMYFEYSMYMLSKRFPPAYQCRLYDEAIEVNALGPPGGPVGLLEHNGAFLVRQKDATLREATRLVPTEQELAEALAQQREEGRGVASVGGVLYYVLPPQALLSTLKSELIGAAAPEDLDPDELRKALEGYGPTGLWRLKLFNLEELRGITDVIFHFGFVASVDAGVTPADLETRIEDLVRGYETELARNGEPLDKITAFSLRQLFPDAFDDLSTGATVVQLDRSDFPSGLANLQFKALVAQALDEDDRGVQGIRIQLGRDDVAFRRERVTQRGGFSENLDAEIEILALADRFPVEGAWQIQLLDPQQFSLLGDLRLFFMYSYE